MSSIEVTSQSQTACTALLRSFLSRPGPVMWHEWIPITLLATDSPESWLSIFQGLSLENQFDCLALLRKDEAGPFADGLLLLLANRAAEISDVMLQQLALEDAVDAHERNGQRLQRFREHVAILTSSESVMRSRLNKEFDIGAEIMRLEMEIATIRRTEYDHDERFNRIHALENEILRQETRQKVLESYDETRRLRYKEDLIVENEALEQRKKTIEMTIVAAIAARDSTRRDLEAQKKQEDTVTRELTEVRSAHRESAERTKLAQEQLQETRTHNNALRKEIQAIMEEGEILTREQGQLSEVKRRERKRLEALRAQTEKEGYANIAAKIREVLQMLPADQGDEGFHPPSRRTA